MTDKKSKQKEERYKQVSVMIGNILDRYSVRSKLDRSLVQKYSEMIDLPDITLAMIKGEYYLVDGRHRLLAIKLRIQNEMWDKESIGNSSMVNERIDSTHIVANLDTSIKTEKQLIVAMVEANVKHGLPYSEEDRLLNAKLLQKQGKNQRQIAKIFGVDPSTVSKWLKPETTKKKEDIKEKVLEKKEQLEAKGEKDIHRKIAEDPEIPVSPATVRRIIKKADEEPEPTLEARTIQDTTNFDKALEHVTLAQRHMIALEKNLSQYVYNETQYTRLDLQLDDLFSKIAKIHASRQKKE